MASDLTPEELAELRTWYGMATDRGDAKVSRHQAQAELWNLLTCEGWQRPTAQIRIGEGVLPKLLDMAERCADYDRRLSEVMPKDFKDWHQNAKAEWPEVAAGTITNLRQREDWAHEQMARALEKAERCAKAEAEVAKLRERLEQAEGEAFKARRRIDEMRWASIPRHRQLRQE